MSTYFKRNDRSAFRFYFRFIYFSCCCLVINLYWFYFLFIRENTAVSDARYVVQSAYVKELKALFEKTGYVPSRVLVEGLAEIGKILEEGRNYMAGLEGKEKRRIALLLESIESLQN